MFIKQTSYDQKRKHCRPQRIMTEDRPYHELLDEGQLVHVLRQDGAEVRVLLLDGGEGVLDNLRRHFALELKAHGDTHIGADLLPEAERALDVGCWGHHLDSTKAMSFKEGIVNGQLWEE
jgi:hypothetical protein